MQTLLPWKSNKYYIIWECVCRLRYSACKAHAPYFHLWPVRLYSILPHCLLNDMIFGKMLLNIKCVSWFSLQFCLKYFSFWEEFSEILSKCKYFVMWSTRYSSQILMELEFSRKIFEKYSNMKFHENPSSGSRQVRPGGRWGERTDGETDMTKLTVAFRNSTIALNKTYPVE